jgi:hypothetical protein
MLLLLLLLLLKDLVESSYHFSNKIRQYNLLDRVNN